MKFAQTSFLSKASKENSTIFQDYTRNYTRETTMRMSFIHPTRSTSPPIPAIQNINRRVVFAQLSSSSSTVVRARRTSLAANNSSNCWVLSVWIIAIEFCWIKKGEGGWLFRCWWKVIIRTTPKTWGSLIEWWIKFRFVSTMTMRYCSFLEVLDREARAVNMYS